MVEFEIAFVKCLYLNILCFDQAYMNVKFSCIFQRSNYMCVIYVFGVTCRTDNRFVYICMSLISSHLSNPYISSSGHLVAILLQCSFFLVCSRVIFTYSFIACVQVSTLYRHHRFRFIKSWPYNSFIALLCMLDTKAVIQFITHYSFFFFIPNYIFTANADKCDIIC